MAGICRHVFYRPPITDPPIIGNPIIGTPIIDTPIIDTPIIDTPSEKRHLKEGATGSCINTAAATWCTL
jgi:hypothetical protein